MFTLNKLPYPFDALAPHISARTMELHYTKHHQAYVDNLNKLIAGTDREKETLENIILQTVGQPAQAAIFNNAAQHSNHNFFWSGLRPTTEKMEPRTEIIKKINSAFGSLDNFYAEFKTAALSQFGSGWVWLISEGESLKIMKTGNADTPSAHGLKPLFALDIWEHAYYLDYQNRRGDYVDAVLKNLINWNFLNANL